MDERGTGTTYFTIRLPENWLAEIKRRAKKAERTPSAEVRLALRAWLGEETDDRPRAA